MTCSITWDKSDKSDISRKAVSALHYRRLERQSTTCPLPAAGEQGPKTQKSSSKLQGNTGGCARASEEVDYFIHDRAAQKQDPAISANCGEMASPTGFEPVLPG